MNTRNAGLSMALSLCLFASQATAAAGKEWNVAGGDSHNLRYSSLKQINTGNVGKLRVSWIFQLGTLSAQQSTPVVVGDTMYVTTSSGPKYVYALNLRDGTIKWKYQPELPQDMAQYGCCDVINRGVAVANGKVFLGRLDGNLVALDAQTGKEVWKTTVVDYTQGSVITAAPTIARNLVITGYGGGEYGARGAITAYDQSTGKQVWRTYTIPEPGQPGSETWPNGEGWKHGGATAWHTGSYDAERNLVYYGTSNPGPWTAGVRGPGTSDYGNFTNLYTASTVALDADSGEIKWHYQHTPHDAWDFDAVSEKVLVDRQVDGKKQPLLFTADKNGFFYVLNRENGKLISAKPFVPVNWATGIDMNTGRPIENPEKRPGIDKTATDICPSIFGGKNWPPMSYNPQTGLVYIPTFNLCMDLSHKKEEYNKGKFYLGIGGFDLSKPGPGGHLGELVAWDPIKQQKAWGNTYEMPFLGGTLTTAGDLVFHGTSGGWFKALNAKTGKQLWKFNTGSGISQGAVTYMLDGKQYVAVVSGRLNSVVTFTGAVGEKVLAQTPEGGAVVVFELGK